MKLENKIIRLVCEKNWITGYQARMIAQASPDLNFEIVDSSEVKEDNDNYINHLLLWGQWKPVFGTNFLVTVHHLDESHSNYDLFCAYDVISRAKKIIVPCSQTQNFLAGHFGLKRNKIYKIPYFVDTSRFTAGKSDKIKFGIPPMRHVIGHFSSLHPRKGTAFLCQAFCRLLKKRKNLHLLLIAGKPDSGTEAELNKILEILDKVMSHVTIVHHSCVSQDYFDVSALNSFYRSMDIYCSPSFIEGGPVPALEALACGVPVVLSSTGMAASMIKKNCGVLVKAGNPASIAEGILRVLQNRRCFAENAVKAAEYFSPSKYVRKHRKIYESFNICDDESPCQNRIRTLTASHVKPLQFVLKSNLCRELDSLAPSASDRGFLVIKGGSMENTRAVCEEIRNKFHKTPVDLICGRDSAMFFPDTLRVFPVSASKITPHTLGIRRLNYLSKNKYRAIFLVTRLTEKSTDAETASYENLFSFFEYFKCKTKMVLTQ